MTNHRNVCRTNKLNNSPDPKERSQGHRRSIVVTRSDSSKTSLHWSDGRVLASRSDSRLDPSVNKRDCQQEKTGPKAFNRRGSIWCNGFSIQTGETLKVRKTCRMCGITVWGAGMSLKGFWS